MKSHKRGSGHFLRRVFLLWALVAPTALIPSVHALEQGEWAAPYARASRLAAAGRFAEALDILQRLAEARPASVPIHLALAKVAESAGDADRFEKAWKKRVRRRARDVGASVALAYLHSRRNAPRDAHRLLQNALTAGARHPFMLSLLFETTSDRKGFVNFLQRRAAVLPRDTGFSLLLSLALLEEGDVRKAREVVERALHHEPEHPELLLVRSRILHADGREREACRQAELAVGFVAEVERTPEWRSWLEIQAARIFVDCGRHEAASALIVPNEDGFGMEPTAGRNRWSALVRAHLAIEEGSPIRSLTELRKAETLEPSTVEMDVFAESIRSRLANHLSASWIDPTPRARSVQGLALADRSVSLAADAVRYMKKDAPGRRKLIRDIDVTHEKLSSEGMVVRAERLASLSSWLGGTIPTPKTSARERETSEVPGLAVVRALIAVSAHQRRQDFEAAGRAGQIDPLSLVGAHGRLKAALRIQTASSLLEVGDAAGALESARQGVLDVLEADRNRLPVPPEFLPLVSAGLSQRSTLAGLAFRARIASGVETQEALPAFFSDVSDAVAGWTAASTPWPTSPEEIVEWIPSAGCLVMATPPPQPIAIAMARAHAAAVSAPEDVLKTPPCRDARIVYWLGPHAPRAGLALGTPPRTVIRILRPTPTPRPHRQAKATRWNGRVLEIGSGESGRDPLMTKDPSDPAHGGRLHPDLEEGWPLYTGKGLTLEEIPSGAGWFAPESLAGADGWIGPESIPARRSGSGPGLIVLGTTMPADSRLPEAGAWMLADGAKIAGYEWTLLSRRPLEPDEIEIIENALSRWQRHPLTAAENLTRAHPALAESLCLWAEPGPGILPRKSSFGSRFIVALGGICALLLLWFARRVFARRSARSR